MARRCLTIVAGLAVVATAGGQAQGTSLLPVAHAQQPGDPPAEETSPDDPEPDDPAPEAATPGDEEEAPADEAEGVEAADPTTAEGPEAPPATSQPGAATPGDPTPQNTLAAVRAAISNVAGVDASQISSATSFQDDLQLDSLSFLEILVDLGIRFGFDGAPARSELGSLRTVADAVRWVDAKRPR